MGLESKYVKMCGKSTGIDSECEYEYDGNYYDNDDCEKIKFIIALLVYSIYPSLLILCWYNLTCVSVYK